MMCCKVGPVRKGFSMFRPHLAMALGAALLVAPVTAAIAAPPPMTVYKSPWCGCCGAWVDHARAAGFTVEVKEMDDVYPIKDVAGVPYDLASCHTTSVGGYAVEGHVPADVIYRLLEEKPDVAGIAVPGMPAGSPGMEGASSAPVEPYDVVLFNGGEATGIYATVSP
jgi:hypothetical protein